MIWKMLARKENSRRREKELLMNFRENVKPLRFLSTLKSNVLLLGGGG